MDQVDPAGLEVSARADAPKGLHRGSRPLSQQTHVCVTPLALGDSHLRGTGPVAPEQRIPHDDLPFEGADGG